MFDRSRALLALALVAALTAGGFAAAAAARSSSGSSSSEGRSDQAGFLGVNLQDLSPDLKDSYGYDGNGVVVSSVVPDSPADKIGIQEGDIITRFNDLAVNNADQLTARVRAMSPGTRANVTVWRDGKSVDLGRAEIGSMSDNEAWGPRVYRYDSRAPRAPRPPEPPRAHRAPMPPDGHDMDGDLQDLGPRVRALVGSLGRGRLGVETRDLDEDLGSYFGAPDGKGVLVLRVVDDTPADRAGLKAGDVILSVDGDRIGDTDELRGALRDKPAGDVELRVRRKGAERTVRATLEKPMEVNEWLGHGNGNWMGWMDDDGGMMFHGPSWKMKDDKDRVRVYRYRIPDGGGPEEYRSDGMSDGDRDQLRREMDQLRRDLEQMKRELKNDAR